MFRVYWNINRNEIHSETPTSTVQRVEGGWWFAEEFENGNRRAFRIIERDVLLNGEIVMELLEPLGDDFIQTPCWKDGSPQPWMMLSDQRQQGSLEECIQLKQLSGQSLMACNTSSQVHSSSPPSAHPSSQEQPEFLVEYLQMVKKGKSVVELQLLPGQRLMACAALEKAMSLPPWVSLVSQKRQKTHEISEIETLWKKYTTSAYRAFSNSASHAQRKPLRQEQWVTPSSQNLQQYSPSRQGPPYPSQGRNQPLFSMPNQQLEEQAPSFVSPKGVQSGSLYPPTLLPETQSLRKTSGHHQGQQRRNQQVHSKAQMKGCLIDLSQS